MGPRLPLDASGSTLPILPVWLRSHPAPMAKASVQEASSVPPPPPPHAPAPPIPPPQPPWPTMPPATPPPPTR